MKRFLLSIILLASTLLHADYVIEYQMDDSVQVFKYHSPTSSKMIMSDNGSDNTIYKIDKKTYMVSDDNGKKTVVDLGKMQAMAKAMGFDASQAMEKKPEFKIKKTGKKSSVAGIKGEEWILTGEDDGEPYTAKVVVTRDKEVVKTVRAMNDLFSSMSGANVDDSYLEPQKGYVIIKADEMQLKSFKKQKVASSEYQLPTNAQEQQVPNIANLKKGLVDSCYNQVCCGSTDGTAKVLAPALKNSFKGYELVGTGVCNTLGISSVFGKNSVEGALYKKGKDTIQITLNMDDKDKVILTKTKNNLDAGHGAGMVSSIKNYSKGSYGAIKSVEGELIPMQQQTLELFINDKTTLTLTRITKTGKEMPLSKVINFRSNRGGISLSELREQLAMRVEKEEEEKASNPKPQRDLNSDEDLNEAVNMLKSFF